MRRSPLDPGPRIFEGEPESASTREIDELLRRGHERGSEEYGPLALPFGVFAPRALHLTRRRLRASGVDPSPERIAGALAGAARADLFLAIACEEGIAGAWEAFLERYVPRLRALARSCGAQSSEADEIARELPGELVARPGEGGVRTRLGTYDGTGKLFTWLAVMVARRVADRFRARRSLPGSAAPMGDAPATDVPDRSRGATDPSVLAIDAETASRLREALRRAWAGLDGRASRALLLKFRDGLPQKEIAARLGLSDSRVSRILAASLERIRGAVQERFLADFPGRWREGESFWNAMREAVARHLQEFRPPPEPLPPDGRLQTT
ncbi:MAG TPA: sigma-70 family RNA polymerase sigma factor [Planctomycetota bacterium]|jgi:RNA polymerase sigma factor (sigma-70 family)|nr:sigma-70 family RNA polymerase sigma factor [Planctomycetota bacterium]